MFVSNIWSGFYWYSQRFQRKKMGCILQLIIVNQELILYIFIRGLYMSVYCNVELKYGYVEVILEIGTRLNILTKS